MYLVTFREPKTRTEVTIVTETSNRERTGPRISPRMLTRLKDLIMLKAIEEDEDRRPRMGEDYYKLMRDDFILHIAGVVEVTSIDGTVQSFIEEGYHHVD